MILTNTNLGWRGLAFLFLCAISVVGAQTIDDIDVQFLGSGRLSDGIVLANMRTSVGDQLDEVALDEDLKRLYDSGLIESASFLREPLGDGVRLIVAVEVRTKFREILFVGNTAISGKKLRNKIELAPNQSWDDAGLNSARQDIAELYAKAGFPDVDVSYRIDSAEDGFSRITFAIDEGQRAVLNDIQFEGNHVFTTRQLLAEMKTKERKLLRLFGRNGKIDNRLLEDDVLAIEGVYRDSGYINARVTEIERLPSGTDGGVDLVVSIDEGSHHTVSAVRVSGADGVSSETILAKLQLQVGDSYSSKAIREDIHFLRSYYGRIGYLNLHVRPVVTTAGAGEVDLEYSIYEGISFDVGKVKIVGNEVTQDRVIRRELAILPGESFNTSLLEASASRVRGLPNFSRVEFTPVESSENGYKDVHISVTEKPTGQIRFGGGFSSIDNVVGFLTVEQKNFDLTNWPKFTGAGQKFRLNLQAGAKRRDFELDFVEPWFAGNDLALRTGAYYHDIFYNSDLYDERHLGGQASLRKRVGEHSSISGGYKLDLGKVHNIDGEASEEIAAEAGDFTDSMLFAEYNVTTLDDFEFPRSGYRFNLRSEFSGLGGDVKTYAVEMKAAKYYHLPLDTVFHVEGMMRTVNSYGSGGVPIYKREFLGGATNLRGYDYREVGPKDTSGEPLGGLASLYGTAELSTPLPGKLGNKVRLATFVDVGAVGSGAWEVGDVYGDVGVGVRLFLFKDAPPLRVDYAFPLKTDRFGDGGGKLSVQMGFKF